MNPVLFLLTVIAVAAYFLGAIPFGLLISRARGMDIRQHGSGNIGRFAGAPMPKKMLSERSKKSGCG